MLKIIRRHQKKLLAVFTAGLMIVFVADIGIRRMSDQDTDPRGKVIGTFGETEVRLEDVRRADAELKLLLYQILVPTNATDPRAPQFSSVLQAIGVPERVVVEWLEQPLAFLLLQEEARRMPVYVDPAQLDFWMNRVAVRLADQRVVSLSSVPEATNNVRASLADLLLVINAFNRATEVVKVSRPFVLRAATEDSQRLTVSAVTIEADKLLDQAPQPTREQLQAFFVKYADVPPETSPTTDNPLGFGYRYPPRVKLQYIAIPIDQIRQVVKAAKDDYTWELLANRYFLEHETEFPTTAATTNPATVPSTQPFELVRDTILDRLMAPEVQKRGDEIRRKIEATMAADYQKWSQANQPATAPADASQPVASSLGTDYDSFEYLQKLAESVQSEFGVLPATASIGEWMSEAQLAKVEGIGEAAGDVFDLAAALASTQPARNVRLLRLFEPSRPVTGESGTLYIYRLTAADRAHAPAEVGEVAQAVERDWKTAWAWEQANNEARELAVRARQSNLAEAAGSRPVLTVGPFPRYTMGAIPGLEIPDMSARARFLTDAYKLVSDLASGSEPHPVRLIELPLLRQTMVVQLAALESRLAPADLRRLEAEAPISMRQEWGTLTSQQWFSFQGVASRLGFVDRESAEQTAAAAVP